MTRCTSNLALLPLFCSLSCFPASLAFVTSYRTLGWNPSSVRTMVPITSLDAKSAKRKKKNARAKVSSKGGFGKVSTSVARDTTDDGDYSVFPSLERNVEETLVPWLGETSEDTSGELPLEIMDRLAQIYGFPRFNAESIEDESSTGESCSSASFGDLLSSSTTKTSKTEFDDILKPSSGGDPLSDLLTSATGGSSDSGMFSKTATETAPNLPLSSLKPFSKFRVLHVDPLVLAIDDFFPDDLCDKYVAMSEAPSSPKEGPMQIRSRTVGKDYAAKAQRSSTTWFHHYKVVPELMAKASRLLGLTDIDSWEEPQVVRYRRTEKFTWHLDALAPAEASSDSGGQRTATLLVYLADLTEEEGGATMFRDLGGAEGPLKVRPKKGSALLFFPAAGGINNCPFDIRTLHCGEAVASDAKHDKWIAQLWLRQGAYTPTAPQGNTHAAASEAISEYCTS